MKTKCNLDAVRRVDMLEKYKVKCWSYLIKVSIEISLNTRARRQ